jgi:hypothetical protein
LNRWLSYVENLNATDEMVCVCKMEVGEKLSDEDERSSRDIVDCQEGRDELPNFQVGNEMWSVGDLIDCQEGRGGSSNFQEGNE